MKVQYLLASTGNVIRKYELSCKYFSCGNESFCDNELLEYCQSNCRLEDNCLKSQKCLQSNYYDNSRCVE